MIIILFWLIVKNSYACILEIWQVDLFVMWNTIHEIYVSFQQWFKTAIKTNEATVVIYIQLLVVIGVQIRWALAPISVMKNEHCPKYINYRPQKYIMQRRPVLGTLPMPKIVGLVYNVGFREFFWIWILVSIDISHYIQFWCTIIPHYKCELIVF